jgi:hypothetical protein
MFSQNEKVQCISFAQKGLWGFLVYFFNLRHKKIARFTKKEKQNRDFLNHLVLWALLFLTVVQLKVRISYLDDVTL